MPSKSKKQQNFFKWIKAVQEGKTKGEGKIKELANSMSKKDVKDFADYLEEDSGTKMNKQALSQNMKELIQYAAISSLVGSSLAGMYGLSRYYSDSKNNPKKIEKLKNQMNKAKNINAFSKQPEEEALTETVENSDQQPDITLVDAFEEEKLSSFRKSSAAELGSILYGAATPVAMIAPALLAYHFTKKYIDRARNKNLSSELEKAKKEFENIVSEKQSALQQQVDNLYFAYKQAGTIQIEPEDTLTRPKGVYGSDGTPLDIHHGFSLSLPGILFGGGALAGLTGIGAYMLLKNRLKKDPEVEKAKALEKILQKNLSADALQSGITVSETSEGKKVIDLG